MKGQDELALMRVFGADPDLIQSLVGVHSRGCAWSLAPFATGCDTGCSQAAYAACAPSSLA